MSDNTARSFIFDPAIFGVICIVLGWLLGLLSSPIVQYINRKKELADFKNGLSAELNEIKIHLALSSYLANKKIGNFTKKIIDRCYSVLKAHKEELIIPRLVDTLEKMLKYSDDKIEAYNKQRLLEGSEKTLHFKKYEMPFYNQKINNLPLLERALQSLMIKIHIKINSLNEITDKNNFYFNKTFEKLSAETGEIIRNNLTESCGHIAKQSDMIIDLIIDAQKQLQ